MIAKHHERWDILFPVVWGPNWMCCWSHIVRRWTQCVIAEASCVSVFFFIVQREKIGLQSTCKSTETHSQWAKSSGLIFLFQPSEFWDIEWWEPNDFVNGGSCLLSCHRQCGWCKMLKMTRKAHHSRVWPGFTTTHTPHEPSQVCLVVFVFHLVTHGTKNCWLFSMPCSTMKFAFCPIGGC